jgi:hypothetical protein
MGMIRKDTNTMHVDINKQSPITYCSCAQPDVVVADWNKQYRITYCDRCKLLLRRKDADESAARRVTNDSQSRRSR